MVVHQVVSETTPYQIQKKFYILGKFLLRKSYKNIEGVGSVKANFRTWSSRRHQGDRI